MSKNPDSSSNLSDRDEIASDNSIIQNNPSKAPNQMKCSQMGSSTKQSDAENIRVDFSNKDCSSEELIKNLAFNKNCEKDPRRFIKITEIIEINDLIDSDANNLIKPCNEFTVSNHTETIFNSLSRKSGQNISMSSSHSFDSPSWQKEKAHSKELPIKIEKSKSNSNNLTEPVQNTEIVLEILNAVSSLETASRKPKKIIVKITGRTRSTEPNSESNKSNFGRKDIHHQHENLSQYLSIKPNAVRIGNRVPYYNFRPIVKEELNQKDDQNGDHIFDLEKFKSYFNSLNKPNPSRSFSMPPNLKQEIIRPRVEKSADFSNDVFQRRSSFKKINRNLTNLHRDYACSDSEDSVWTHRNKNDCLSKNFIRSNSTTFRSFSNNNSQDRWRDHCSPSSHQDFSIKNESLAFCKRKDVDLYQESLRRNFAKSDKKFEQSIDSGKNGKNISSYYNKFYSHLNDLNKKKSEDSISNGKNDFEKANVSVGELDEKNIESSVDFEKYVTHFNHNNRQCLSTFLPIKNSQQTSHIKSHSINSSPNKFTKQTRRVLFADELN